MVVLQKLANSASIESIEYDNVEKYAHQLFDPPVLTRSSARLEQRLPSGGEKEVETSIGM